MPGCTSSSTAAKRPSGQGALAAGAAQPASGGKPSQGSQAALGLAAAELTAEQRDVLRRVLAWDDYVLVMGLPGSGKTSTICALAQVCSTHVAY